MIKKYGVVLYENEDVYQIEIDNEGNPLNKGDEEVINRHKDNINSLLNKAKEKWEKI